MKKFLLAATLFFIPSLVNAQTGYRGPHLNHPNNNFGVQLYPGYFNGYGYQNGLSYYPNSQFYSVDGPSSRSWYHQGYISPYRHNYGNNYYQFNNYNYYNNYYRGR